MKRSLLTIGYARPGFGFGRVLGELHTAFADDFDITHLDLAAPFVAQTHAPSSQPRRMDATDVARIMSESSHDVALIFADIDTVCELTCAMRLSGTRVVAYMAIDSPVMPSPALAGLATLDVLAVYTTFARDSLLDALAQLSLPAPRVEVLPHGCDIGMFFPLDAHAPRARTMARDALFGADHAMGDTFIVLNANRNQPRKRVDLTLQAFRRFLDIVPDADAKLYLHMGLRDRGSLILPLAGSLGIDDRLLLTGTTLDHPSSTDTHLNLLYNACDVGLNTADAEGWGLIAFEHAATGRAQLVPAHTGCGELWRDHALMIPAEPYHDIALNRSAFEVDVDAIADDLARLYTDVSLRATYDALAFHNATVNTLTWRDVGQRLKGWIHGH